MKLYKCQKDLAKQIVEALLDKRKPVPMLQIGIGRRQILLSVIKRYNARKRNK